LIGLKPGIKTIAAEHSQCRSWVMSAGRDPAVAAVHVCFAPKATTEPSHSNPPLSADIVAKVFF
jgi:hypothetical protein